jgi:predicted nucleic acid-binding protein
LDAAALVDTIRVIRACRDPDDDKFLEVAVNGKADALITGDTDLLVLDPLEGIPIITPAACLTKIGD